MAPKKILQLSPISAANPYEYPHAALRDRSDQGKIHPHWRGNYFVSQSGPAEAVSGFLHQASGHVGVRPIQLGRRSLDFGWSDRFGAAKNPPRLWFRSVDPGDSIVG